MKNIFILTCLITLSLGWTLTLGTHCKCSDYLNIQECDYAAPYGCYWGDTSCGTLKCAELILPEDCLTATETCAYNPTTQLCGTFSSCSSLKGSSIKDCANQNLQCTWTSGSSCTDFTCNKFTSDTCPNECKKTTSGCTNYQCSTLNIVECAYFPSICVIQGLQCRSIVCTDYTVQETCIAAYDQGTTIQPCFWNTTATVPSCVNAAGPQNFNQTTCASNTLGQYHWSSNSTTGSCSQCTGSGTGGGSNGVLLQLLFALSLLLA